MDGPPGERRDKLPAQRFGERQASELRVKEDECRGQEENIGGNLSPLCRQNLSATRNLLLIFFPL
jgi:hypothetical protein